MGLCLGLPSIRKQSCSGTQEVVVGEYLALKLSWEYHGDRCLSKRGHGWKHYVFQDWMTRPFVFVGSSLILSLFFLPASLQWDRPWPSCGCDMSEHCRLDMLCDQCKQCLKFEVQVSNNLADFCQEFHRTGPYVGIACAEDTIHCKISHALRQQHGCSSLLWRSPCSCTLISKGWIWTVIMTEWFTNSCFILAVD